MLFGIHLDKDDEDDDDDVDDDLVQNIFRPLQVSQAVHFDWTDGNKGCLPLLTLFSFHQSFFATFVTSQFVLCVRQT